MRETQDRAPDPGAAGFSARRTSEDEHTVELNIALQWVCEIGGKVGSARFGRMFATEGGRMGATEFFNSRSASSAPRTFAADTVDMTHPYMTADRRFVRLLRGM